MNGRTIGRLGEKKPLALRFLPADSSGLITSLKLEMKDIILLPYGETAQSLKKILLLEK